LLYFCCRTEHRSVKGATIFWGPRLPATFYEDRTGQEIIRVLLDQVKLRKIEIVDRVYIIKLLKSDDVGEKEEVPEVKGAIGIDIKKKEIVLFESKSLILATGGYTRVYAVSSSRIFENYGEGLALAYEEI
jgi:succinate dehydrogenase/fumarate reductase flavoprotein subunit